MCQGQAVLLRSCWKKIPKPAPGATSSLEGKPEGSCLVRRKPKEGVSSALCLVCQSGSALTPPQILPMVKRLSFHSPSHSGGFTQKRTS